MDVKDLDFPVPCWTSQRLAQAAVAKLVYVASTWIVSSHIMLYLYGVDMPTCDWGWLPFCHMPEIRTELIDS